MTHKKPIADTFSCPQQNDHIANLSSPNRTLDNTGSRSRIAAINSGSSLSNAISPNFFDKDK